MYSIHPLVHDWIHGTMSHGKATCVSAQCILGMLVSWEFASEDYSFRWTLLPHIDVALRGGPATGPDLTEGLGLIYSEGGRWKEARELRVLVMEMRKQVLGEEHPDLLRSISALASTYWNKGPWKEAEELQVLEMETTVEQSRCLARSILIC